MNYDHKTQVGGDHYNQGSKPQHWDLVLMYQWDYFQGQIIKYLMRWKYKYEQPEKRLEDLKKARNFLDKYIDEEERKLVAEKMAYEAGSMIAKGNAIKDPMRNYPTPGYAMLEVARKPAFIEGNEHWSNEGYYGDMTQLYKCRHCRSTVRTSGTPPPHGCTPGTPTPSALEQQYPPLETGDIGVGQVLGAGVATIYQTGSGNS